MPRMPDGRRTRFLAVLVAAAAAAIVALTVLPAFGNVDGPVTLPYQQAWTNTGQITANDDWSGVPGVQGYLGEDDITTGLDPRDVTGETTTTDVIANQTNPNTLTSGGVAEFQMIPDPVVALQGSGTADRPNLVFRVDTAGRENLNLAFNARDIDGSADNAAQPIAVQYRVGSPGAYTRTGIAAGDGYVADATTGPSLATQTTPVSVTLPDATDNQSQVYLRVQTTNAVGNDEWVGIDDINITAPVTPPAQPPGAFSVTDVTVSEGNTGSSDATFTVTRSESSAAAASVDFATADGSASSASDFTPKSGTLTFAAGETTQTVTVAVTGDTTVEPDETFTLNLANPSGATIADGQGTGTITNDDAAAGSPGTIQFSEPTFSQGESGPTATITVTRTAGSTGAVSATYTTSNGTATAGSDYQASSGTVSFADGDTADKTFTVPITQDSVDEADETVNLTLSGPTGGASLGSPSRATLTIVDDDAPNEPITAACGGTLSTVEGTAVSREVTASDPDGTVDDIAITVDPPQATISRTAFTPEQEGAGAQPARATVTVGASTPKGTYTVTARASNTDDPEQERTCSFTVVVEPLRTIGEVQGPIADTDDGFTKRSPFAPASGSGSSTDQVVVQGVIYEKTRSRSGSSDLRGFFIQNTAATDDDNANTSDGIFVFTSTFDTLIGGYTPQVGDEVQIRAKVAEFFDLTQLTSASLVRVVRNGVPLTGAPSEIPPFITDPPNDLNDAYRYWERREGMRAQVPATSPVVHGRVAFSNADAEVWAIRSTHPVASRPNVFERRVFRDSHPLDNNTAMAFDDLNGYRILMGSLGLKGGSGDSSTMIAPARTFDTITNAPTGGVYFSFGKYSVQPEAQIATTPGANPASNAAPQRPDRPAEYEVATYNLENLYDFRDDPFDGCDFASNTGCPGVNPPFDYVPPSLAGYQGRLAVMAQQITDDLHSPEIILTQEAEDQDICTAGATALNCGTTNNADGKPDTLQELALAIKARGGPAYDAALDRDGADDRGIVAGFLYRTDRVELLPAPAGHPVLGASPSVTYRGAPAAYNTQQQNPKSLNATLPADVDRTTGTDGNNVFTRAPQVGLFRVYRTAVGTGPSVDVNAISNHFSSRPDARVGQRREQAAYNAAIADAIEAASGTSQRVLIGGDLNVYPRPDDPFPLRPGDTTATSDQLGPLYRRGLANLYDMLLAENPASAYSYVFQGQAQVLDHLFVNPFYRGDVRAMRAAHINADWPSEFEGDGPRGVSDHDPQVARFGLPAQPGESGSGPPAGEDRPPPSTKPPADFGPGGDQQDSEDDTRPVLRRLRVTPRGARRRGRAVAYRLSENATVAFALERVLPGRRSRGRCVAPQRAAGGKRCVRYEPVGDRASARGRAGRTNRVALGSIIGNAPSGLYRLLAVATDGSGNASRVRTIRFRIR